MSDRPVTNIDMSWEGGFRFTSRDRYGHSIAVDAPASEGDDFDGFKPGELLLASLAGCSGIDVVEILRKQRQHVTALEIQVRGVQRPDPPWTWEEIHLDYVVKGKGLSPSAVQRAIHLSETSYCSVGATLAGRAKITSAYQIVEDGPAD